MINRLSTTNPRVIHRSRGPLSDQRQWAGRDRMPLPAHWSGQALPRMRFTVVPQTGQGPFAIRMPVLEISTLPV